MALFINGVGQNSFAMNGVDIDNLYVDGVLVFTSVPQVAGIPRYELTETLVDASTVDDSANTLTDYNGLLTESDGTTPYEPTALQYPGNGLLELDNGRIMDTQYVRQEEDAQYGIYGADGSTIYNIWAIQWAIGDLYTVWEGDQDTPLTSTGGHNLTIPPGTMKITGSRPSWLPSFELIYGAGNDNGRVDGSFWTAIPGNSQACGRHTVNSVEYLNGYTNVADSGQYQSFTTQIGETYEVNLDLLGGSNFGADPDGVSSTYVCVTDTIPGVGHEGTESIETVSLTPVSDTFDYVATATTTYIAIKTNTVWNGGNASKISVKIKA